MLSLVRFVSVGGKLYVTKSIRKALFLVAREEHARTISRDTPGERIVSYRGACPSGEELALSPYMMTQ